MSAPARAAADPEAASRLPEAPPAARLGPLELAPGVTTAHAVALLFAAFTTLGLLTFISVGTPYVLNQTLHVPAGDQGRVSGNLVFWTELTQLLTFTLFGVLADRIGRRGVYALGFLVMALGYALYPIAENTDQLTVYRILYALGIAATTCMLSTVVSDYPREASRGRMVAIVGVFNGLGIVVCTAVLGKLPKWFTNAGFDAAAASRRTYFVIAGIAVLSALVVGFGLKPGIEVRREDRPPVRRLLAAGLRAFRNPRIALAFSAAFVARGDLVILGTFTNLWGQSAAIAHGLTAAEAVGRGRIPFIVAQAASLPWAVVVYFLIDRFRRVTGLALCMALAGLGYLSMYFVRDPLQGTMIPLFSLLGVGQISAFFGATALIGQEAPIAERASVVAMFNLCGAVGILITSKAGGWLFDHVTAAAPFIMTGGLNLLVLVAALIVRARSPEAAANTPAVGLMVSATPKM
jgi:MFS family permease